MLAIAFDVPPPRPGLDPAALRQRVRDVIEHFCTTRAPDAIVSAREAEVVLVAAAGAGPQADGQDARRLASTCLARLAELFPDTRAVIGIGGPCRGPHEITRSYEEAQRTLETLRRLGRAGTVTAFADLGIHRLLLQVPDLAELRSFADDVLGALTRADRDRRAELPGHAGLLPAGEQQPAARGALPARTPEHGRLPGQADRGDHRAVPGHLPGPAEHPGGAGDPGRTGVWLER